MTPHETLIAEKFDVRFANVGARRVHFQVRTGDGGIYSVYLTDEDAAVLAKSVAALTATAPREPETTEP